MLVLLQDTCCVVQYVPLVLVMASAIDQSFLGHNQGLMVESRGGSDSPPLVVIGTHPIPQKYVLVHKKLPSWDGMKELKALLATEEIRKAYN